MQKIKTSITLDPSLVELAQEVGINISRTCENALRNRLVALHQIVLKEQSSRGNSPDTIDWEAFKNWLKADHCERVTRDYVAYGRQFAECLFSRDLMEIRVLPESKRPNVIKALCALAKFLGSYQEYVSLLKQQGLKWTGTNGDDIIIDRLNSVQSPDEIFDWIKEVETKRPEYTNFVQLMAFTGVRFCEAVNSYNLIIQLSREGKLDTYYKRETSTLEHFRFKELFIRRTKKAFLSIVPESLVLEISQKQPITDPDRIQVKVRRKHMRRRFKEIRKAHGSFMTKYLKESEIDFLHGRVGTSVFMQHYYNPKIVGDLRERVFKGIAEISLKIEVSA